MGCQAMDVEMVRQSKANIRLLLDGLLNANYFFCFLSIAVIWMPTPNNSRLGLEQLGEEDFDIPDHNYDDLEMDVKHFEPDVEEYHEYGETETIRATASADQSDVFIEAVLGADEEEVESLN
jgi:hypothetical protein